MTEWVGVPEELPPDEESIEVLIARLFEALGLEEDYDS